MHKDMVYILLIICLVGIFYLAGGFLSLYFLVTEKDKNLRAGYFDNVIGCGAIGLVILGIGAAGLLHLYSYSPSSVNAVVLCLIALPAFLFALLAVIKYVDATKNKEYADEKGEAIAFMSLGTVVGLFALLYTYSNQ